MSTRLWAVGLLALASVAQSACAQNVETEFRVTPTDRNPSACQRWDAELSRVNSFTRTGDSATLRTAGGITRTMTQSAPNVFTTTLALGGTNFDVVADASKTPGTLEVSEPRIGCRWSAIAR
ncbi:hypothetical protein [Reyranella sp.]|uniref:hypothetical protein n=1 Tax=Reyranella sp. TaxID=1929291 RepID=UPI00378306B8